MGEQITLVAPVDLGLGAGDDLEPAMLPHQRLILIITEFGGDPRPGLGQEHLHPLIGTGEPVLGDQPLVDHAALQRDVLAQPHLDHADERGDDLRLGAHPRRSGRGDRGGVLGQVLPNGAPIDLALAGDLGIGSACSMQGAETTDVHTGLRIKDHEQRHPSGSSTWRWTNRRVTSIQGEEGLNSPRPTYTSGRTRSDTRGSTRTALPSSSSASGASRSSKASRAAGKYSRNVERSRAT
jgi:hypothetical protein